MNYGFPYKGSKNKIAGHLLSQLPSGKRFVDLFGGGGAMSHCAILSGKYESVLYNELNSVNCNLMQDIIDGRFKNFVPEWISREKFFELKETDGYVKYCWSFGNNGRDYMFSKDIEPVKKAVHNELVFDIQGIKEYFPTWDCFRGVGIKNRRSEWSKFCRAVKKGDNSDRRLEQLEQLQQLERLERLKQFEISNKSYLNVDLKDGDVIYCDPPYINTNKYDFEFDYDEFWQWVRACKHTVFVSEYTAPSDFEPIFSIKKRSTLSSTNNSLVKTENLYCNRKLHKLSLF